MKAVLESGFRKHMRLLRAALLGAIAAQAPFIISCSKTVVRKPSDQPTPSREQNDIDISQIKNLSITVDLWSCDDTKEKTDRESFLFREALRTLKSKFPNWNIVDHPARPSV